MFLLTTIRVFHVVPPFENWEYYAVVELIIELADLMLAALLVVMK